MPYVTGGLSYAKEQNSFIIPSGGASINRGDKFDTKSVMVTSSLRF
ncbi:MAG: hypothetical protein QM681_02060 [Novosphingobium sp.]